MGRCKLFPLPDLHLHCSFLLTELHTEPAKKKGSLQSSSSSIGRSECGRLGLKPRHAIMGTCVHACMRTCKCTHTYTFIMP